MCGNSVITHSFQLLPHSIQALKCHSGIEIPFRHKNFEKLFQKKSVEMVCLCRNGMFVTFWNVSQFVPKNLATGC